MRLRTILVRCMLCIATAGPTLAQAPAPILSNIESPYAAIQGLVQIGGSTGPSYGRGAVAYGPVNTPLVLSGKGFSTEGTVNFIPIYYNKTTKTVTTGTAVPATVSMWDTSILFLTVPQGATTGQVMVKTKDGLVSNSLPFVVTNGAYNGSGAMCQAFPTNTQLQIATSSLPNAAVGTPYSATLHAVGGKQPYTWSLSGSAPSWLSLNASSGLLSGTPPNGAPWTSITVDVTDSTSVVAQAFLDLGVDSSAVLTGPIYRYTVPSSGYDHAGNLLTYTDLVMGRGALGMTISIG